MDFAAFCRAAAGLLFNECSDWGGWRGRGGWSADAGHLLVCERPVDGFSWSPPGRALQAHALRELVAVHDVVLQGAFPAAAGWPTALRLRAPVWWPTQVNRQGDGGELGPHVVERLQLLLRGRARRHEALHREARPWGKTLV